MKTLTVTISDKAAAELDRQASASQRSVEDIVASVVEDAFDDEWWEELSPEDRASIQEGLAQAERGETIPQNEVFAELKRKHGW